LEFSVKAMKISADYLHLYAQALATTCLIAQGKLDKAATILEQANQAVDTANGIINCVISSNKVIVKLHTGDIQDALEITKKILNILLNDQPFASVTVLTFENMAVAIQGFYHYAVIQQFQFTQMAKDLMTAWKNYIKVFPVGTVPLSLYTVKFDRLLGNKQKAVTLAINSLKSFQRDYSYYHAGLSGELGLLTNDTTLVFNSQKMFEKLAFSPRESVFQHITLK